MAATALLIVATTGCGEKAKEAAEAAARQAADSATRQNAVEVVCSWAPSQSAAVGQISAAAGGSAAAAAALANAAGLTAVMHSSGAYILTGAGGYVAGTLGSAIVGPVLVGVGIVVGGSAATLELLCVPKNHPRFVAIAEAATVEFASRSKGVIVSASNRASDSVGSMTVQVQKSAIRVGSDAVEYANRKTVEVSQAVKSLRP